MKKVCIIGGGLSGLTTIKQLLDEGHIPTCYEKEGDLGGVFNYGKHKGGAYDNMHLTISNHLMAFSDDPPQGHRYHWHHGEYKEYLVNYGKKFGLDQYMVFNTIVTKVERVDGEYSVTIRSTWSNEIQTVRFDAIAVCTGTHQIEYVPQITGLQTFTGQIVHSAKYKNSDDFQGKKVVCVGIGESSADIVREVCQVAQSCHLAMRSYPTLLPRVRDTTSSDGNTTRMMLALNQNPPSESVFYYVYGGLLAGLDYLRLKVVQWLGLQAKYEPKIDSFNQQTTPKMLDLDTEYDEESLELIKAWNILSGGRRFLTKNVTFVPYVVNGQIQVIMSKIERINENTIQFQDGRTVTADTIIFCTGYQDDFAFLGEMQPKENNIRNLFMQAFHPEYPDCAFIGWARPTSGGVPACSEMAARYFALLLSGKVNLPENVRDRIEADQAYYAESCASSAYLNSIVEWKRYMDTMAELIGCQVNLSKYLLKPRFLYKLLYGSLIPSQYRLEGPHADFARAKKTIMSLPVVTQHSIRMYCTKTAILMKLGLLPENNEEQFYNHQFFPERILAQEEIDHYRFDGKNAAVNT